MNLSPCPLPKALPVLAIMLLAQSLKACRGRGPHMLPMRDPSSYDIFLGRITHIPTRMSSDERSNETHSLSPK